MTTQGLMYWQKPDPTHARFCDETEFDDPSIKGHGSVKKTNIADARGELARWLWEARHILDLVIIRKKRLEHGNCVRSYFVTTVMGGFNRNIWIEKGQ